MKKLISISIFMLFIGSAAFAGLFNLGIGLDIIRMDILEEDSEVDLLKYMDLGLDITCRFGNESKPIGFLLNFYWGILPIRVNYEDVKYDWKDRSYLLHFEIMPGLGGVIDMGKRFSLLIGGGLHITIIYCRIVSDPDFTFFNMSYGLGLCSTLNIYLAEKVGLFVGFYGAMDLLGLKIRDEDSDDYYDTEPPVSASLVKNFYLNIIGGLSVKF
jgi:hypothetical protein